MSKPSDEPPAYDWDGDPAHHPLRLVREALGWEKAMRFAVAAELDRLDINALEKGKNKGGAARVVNAIARVLYLTPWDVEALLTFRLHPDDAVTRSHENRLMGSAAWAKLTGRPPIEEVRPTGNTPYERPKIRQARAVKRAQRGVEKLRVVRKVQKEAEAAARVAEARRRRAKREAG